MYSEYLALILKIHLQITPLKQLVLLLIQHHSSFSEVLGIEAGRATIIDQIQYTMKQHSVDVDERHLKILADMMTYKGKILGMQR